MIRLRKSGRGINPKTKVGYWTVLGWQFARGGKVWAFVGRCKCGTVAAVNVDNVLRGLSQSCGCTKPEATRNAKTIHGECPKSGRTLLYRVWSSMKDRCHNPNNNSYERYGAKGIRVCKEWRNSFATFAEWARANGYRKGLTIERKKSKGNYEPNNCEWITRAENNRRAMQERWHGPTTQGEP